MAEIVYAPVLITTLCRYEHFKKCIESLKRNTWACYTDVYIGLDYPLKESHRDGYEKICSYLEHGDFSAFKSFNVIKRERNYGASNNSIELKREVLEPYDRFIAAEDDIFFAANFLEYMDKCLDYFENDKSIVGINGYSYPLDYKVSSGANVFLQSATFSAWGVGFWKDRYYRIREELADGYLFKAYDQCKKDGQLKKLIKGRYYDYMYHALTGLNKHFYGASDMALGVYMTFKDMSVVTPAITKTLNLGFDGSGVCCQNIKNIDNKTSITYDYINQPIDENTSFDVILDSDKKVTLNKELLDKFLAVPFKQKFKVWVLIFYSRIFGRQLCVKTVNFLRTKFRRT